ncbi:MAG: DUF2752 domain-containing protein, partial [Kiritimatiellia bacterium]
GMTRSLLHLVRGHWRQSWFYHPFGLLFAAGLGVWMVACLCSRIRRRLHPGNASCRFRPGMAFALLLAAFLIFGILRMTLVLFWRSGH